MHGCSETVNCLCMHDTIVHCGDSIYNHILRLFQNGEVVDKKDRKWMCDVSDVAVKSSASPEASVDNILSYSSVDAGVCEHQLSRSVFIINWNETSKLVNTIY